MNPVLYMNALRMMEAKAYLARAQESLGEIDLRQIGGLTRVQMAEYRAHIREVRDLLVEGQRILRVTATVRPTPEQKEDSRDRRR